MISSTPLNQHLGSTLQGHQHFNLGRNSTHQSPSSGSPYQNPRVRNSIVQGTGPSTSSQRFHPNGNLQQQHIFYASSAPSSSTALPQQSSRTRPPVPLFTSSSTGHLPRETHTMAVGHSPDRIDSPSMKCTVRDMLTLITTDLVPDFFDFSSEHFIDSAQSSPQYPSFEDSTVSGIDFTMPTFASINDPAPAHISTNPQTVSPKDVFMDNQSAPPSSAITNLSTPQTESWDSPFDGYISQCTSPLFSSHLTGNLDFDLGDQNYSSLFPGESESTSNCDSDFSARNVLHGSIETSAPLSMSRNHSSPGQSSSRGPQHLRHSSIAGVNPKRKGPLPPVKIPDIDDPVAVKRAKNTEAARKSRAKKMERVEMMQAEIDRLQAEVDRSQAEAERWKAIAHSQRDSR